MASPIGLLLIEATEQGVRRVALAAPQTQPGAAAQALPVPAVPSGAIAALAQARRQLGEYFSGRRRAFDLTLDAGLMRPFQRLVLQVAREIPPGETLTYGQVAARTGRPRAARAVGQALRRNPFLVVVPCHRVVGGASSPGGYAAGPAAKQLLLHLERP